MMQSILLAGGGAGGLTLISALSGLGLTSGLQVCLDPGDFESYIGSGQSVLDRSTNNFYFFLGTGSGVQTSDPTFSGPAAYPPSYFVATTESPAQFLSYHATNESSFNALHQNGASFSALLLYYRTGAGSVDLWGDDPQALANGMGLSYISPPGYVNLQVYSSGTSVSVLDAIATSTLSAGNWYFIAVSVTEAVGSGFFYLNGNYLQASGADTFDATYLNPSAGNATGGVLRIGQDGGSALAKGNRVSAFALWSRALTKANFDSIWNLMRSRFGL